MSSPAPASGTDRTRRMQQLFDAALEIEESRRATFLAEACGDDLGLRAEVEGLLGSLGRAHTQDLLPPLVPSGAFPAAASPATPSLVGLRIHNYQVDAAIGAGGMAEVYVAHHLAFPRKAALKVLQNRFSGNAEIVQRFINEARAANAIAHPNIIEVIDAGRLEGSGAPYILMEYLDGESLGARLRAGRLPIQEAVRIAIQTAQAVGAAHDKGIVHRDLKPENIFLCRRAGAPPSVKVLDFGIAKLRSDVAGTLAETQVGMIMGTPQYMSPEHCRDASTVDHRTDIYSLGVILYEMVCGKPPFQSASFADLVYQQVAAAPEPPRKFAPDLPLALEAVILRCLAKSPDERYASVQALIDGLQAALPDEQVAPSSGPVSAPVMAGPQPPARSRWKLIGVVAFLLAALGGAGLALRGRGRQHVGASAATATAPASTATATVTAPATPPATTSPTPVGAVATTPAPRIETPAAVAPADINAPAPTRAKRRERHKDAETPRAPIPDSLGTNPY